jgi:RNA polymerase sigma-70 factor (ECF subfamily)
MARPSRDTSLRNAESGSDHGQAAPATVETLLYQAIRRGAPDWQVRVFEHFRSLVYRLLIKALGPNAEIDDLIGDIFVSLFESAGNIKSAAGLRSYVVSVTMNAIRREFSRRRRWTHYFGVKASNLELEQRPALDDPKAKAALLQLSRILDDLHVDERMAFVLHNLEGLPLTEVADALRVSHSTIKRRVKRANRHLMKRVSRNALLVDYIRDRSEADHG